MFSVCSWNATKCVVCTEPRSVALSTIMSKLSAQETARTISISFGCINNEKTCVDFYFATFAYPASISHISG